MDEETKKEPEKEPATVDTGERNNNETTPLIDDANLAAKRMEEANKEKRELLDREETLMAKKALGGTTEAGQAAQPKEESNSDYAKKVMANDLE